MLGFCEEEEEEPKSKSRNLIRNISDSKGVQPEENKSAASEKAKVAEEQEKFKQDLEIEALFRYELGFS